jgi:hypothetical protein
MAIVANMAPAAAMLGGARTVLKLDGHSAYCSDCCYQLAMSEAAIM